MTLYGILGARYHDEVLSQVFVKNKIIKLYANWGWVSKPFSWFCFVKQVWEYITKETNI